MAERQLPATPKRRQKAREQGQSARSIEPGAALALLAVGFALPALGGAAGRAIEGFAVAMWSQPTQDLAGVGGQALQALASAAVPLMLVSVGVGVFASVLQGGVVFSFASVQPQFNRMNPLTGLQGLVSTRGLVNLAKALFKLMVVVFAVYGPISQAVTGLPPLIGNLAAVAGSVYESATRSLTQVAAALLILAAADVGFQRWDFERGLRMSHDEVKEEMRESEGDPQIKGMRRRRQRDLARRRMMHDVARADVVVANPTHFAVALRYAPDEMAAPTVVGKGKGWLAQRLKAIARSHEVPVLENPPLAQALYRSVPLGGVIPPELYQAVAELLAFVWRLKGRSA